ncbi:MAG TPA: serine hydrolase, partial [Pyrinomonadaceae bacterium]
MNYNQLRMTNDELRTKKLFPSLRFCVFAGISFVFCLLFVSFANAQGLPIAAPQTVGMSAAKLNQIDALVNKDIADKKLPGAVVIVGHKGKIVYRKAFGNRSVSPTVEKMTIDTIFDAASLTKPIATATSVMILVEQGKLRLNDTIGRFIPEIQDEDAKKVTVQQLLTHISGYRPDFDLGEKWTGREGMLQALYKEKLRNPAGTRFVYSDIGFIVLGEIIRRISGQELDVFYDANFFHEIFKPSNNYVMYPRFNRFPVALSQNIPGIPNVIPRYVPPVSAGEKIKTVAPTVTPNGIIISNNDRTAPTENIKGQNSYLGSKFEGDEKTGNQMLRGQVHDPTAFRMGGVAGHAGLFSTADDLARYCQIMLNGGILDGKRILSAQTVARMTAPYVVSEDGATRGLGWDMNTSFSSNR